MIKLTHCPSLNFARGGEREIRDGLLESNPNSKKGDG